MNSVRLRYLAQLNPPVPEFDSLPSEANVGFLPLEAVWSDGRADHGRSAVKETVAVGYTRYRTGDVLVPKVTPTFQAGRAMIARKLGAGTTELHVLRPRPGVDPRWIAYSVRSKHFLEEGVTAFQGVAGLQRVPPDFVAEFRVADIASDEQRRIADFLDDRVSRIDRIIAARREQLEAVAELRTSRTDAAFTALSESRTRVSRLLSRRAEYGCLPSETSDDSDLCRYIRTTDIGGLGYLRSEGAVYVDRELLTDYRLVDGDVLVARSGNTIGKCMVYRGAADAVFAGYLVRLQFDEIDPNTFWYFAHSRDFQYQLRAGAVQSTIPNFNAEKYSGIEIPDVRGRESELLSILELTYGDLATGEEAISVAIERLAEYKSSLITAAVTGELDVTTAGSGIPE